MGRSSKLQAAENRERVIEIASRLFQQRGLNGLAIAELMHEAGMTHGAFYRQFPSKDGVAGEACARAMDRSAERWRSLAAATPPAERLSRIADLYLSGSASAHRCAMPTLAADVAREPEGAPVRAAYTQGVGELADVLASCIPGERARALGVLAAMVGAVALARAVDDDALADDIMRSTRQMVAKWTEPDD